MLGTLIAIAASATAFYLSTGLGETWPLAWVAPVPLLCLACAEPRRRAFGPAVIAFYLGSLNLFGYLALLMPASRVATILLGPALALGAAVAWTGRVARNLSGAAAVLAFPAVWTSYEFLWSVMSPHGTALSLAYSQADVLPVLQVVSLTGLWGVLFVLTLVPAAIALAIVRRSLVPLLPAVGLLVLVLAIGVWRLNEPPSPDVVRVGLAATDQDIGRVFQTEDTPTALAIARAYAERIRRLAARGAVVVVLPEKFTGVTPANASAVIAVLADAARNAHVTVVAGLNRVAIQPRRNVAVVLSSDGRTLVEYDKRHMLPGPETGYLVGDRPGLFQESGRHWGVEICKDMDFQRWSRQYAEQDVRLLAVPAWDFVVDGRLHQRMALVRSVEDGFAMARAAQQGLLTVSDAYGRVLASTASGPGPEAALVADNPPGPGATFYSQTGDWFGWLSVVLACALAVRTEHRARSRR